MIEPTPGRIVWCWPDDRLPLNRRSAEQPCAAMVVFVHSPRMVNLIVFDHEGITYPAENITLLQDDDPPPAHGSWAQWMPFQKAQASKEGRAGW